jgi:hypothetical protein
MQDKLDKYQTYWTSLNAKDTSWSRRCRDGHVGLSSVSYCASPLDGLGCGVPLSSSGSKNDDITKLVRRAVVLSLLPQTEAEDVWFNALQDIGDADNVPDTTTFADYVTEHRVETQISLEPLLERGTPHPKPSRGLAQ